LSGSPGRPFAQTGVGEPSSDSLRRVRLAWARLIVLALIHLQHMRFFQFNKAKIKHHTHQNSNLSIHTISKLKTKPQATKLETLTSRTWKSS